MTFAALTFTIANYRRSGNFGVRTLRNLSTVLDRIATSGQAARLLADEAEVHAFAARIRRPLTDPEVAFLVSMGRHFFTDQEHWPEARAEAFAALALYPTLTFDQPVEH